MSHPTKLLTTQDFVEAPVGTRVFFKGNDVYWEKTDFGFATYWISEPSGMRWVSSDLSNLPRGVLRWGNGVEVDEWADDLVLNDP